MIDWHEKSEAEMGGVAQNAITCAGVKFRNLPVVIR